MNKPKSLVVGGGISGLTTGIRLAQDGHNVEIWTKEQPEQTTSATAAAFWLGQADKAEKWGKTSFEQFKRIATEFGDEVGVEERQLLSVFKDYPPMPKWAKVLPTFQRMTRVELQEAFEGIIPEEFQYGFSFQTWMIEMPKYLKYLRQTFEVSGEIKEKEIAELDEAFAEHDLVVNCSALGSRDIEGIEDKTVYSVAGQVVQIRRTIEKTILFDTKSMTYIVPRGDNVILGGTEVDNLYNRTPIEETTAAIVRRCSAFLPGIANIDIQVEKVGLRPTRSEVRLEVENLVGGKTLIHNYGHGGAGVTLSWGCADEVVALAKKAVVRV